MHNNKPPLPKEIETLLEALAYKMGDARRAGDGTRLSELAEQAWDLLPEPKTEWDYHPQTISRAFVEMAPTMGLCGELEIWLDRMYATHFDPARQSEYTNLVAGHALYRCGRTEQATVLFRHVLANHGPRWFSGEYRPYLELAERP